MLESLQGGSERGRRFRVTSTDNVGDADEGWVDYIPMSYNDYGLRTQDTPESWVLLCDHHS